MVEIIFQSEKDGHSLYDHLKKRLKQEYHQNILLIEDRHIFKIRISGLENKTIDIIKGAFFEFIYRLKQEDWFRKILKEKFYFEDPEEQQNILEIIYSVLEGNRKDLTISHKLSNEDCGIREAIEQMFLEKVSFSFDSFVQFRLRSYLKQLESYVEISIDEYKMEQEYQMFVQTLRDFLSKRPEKLSCVHVAFDEEITFFDEHFLEIKRSELAKMIDRRLLFNHPVYVDSVSIAPLLSIAPRSIVIYAEESDQPLIRTIQNIFEERVTLRPISELAERKRNVSS